MSALDPKRTLASRMSCRASECGLRRRPDKGCTLDQVLALAPAVFGQARPEPAESLRVVPGVDFTTMNNICSPQGEQMLTYSEQSA